MATTNWTSKASNVPESGLIIRLRFHVDDNGDPIQASDDTLIKQARIDVTLPLTGDAIQRKTQITRVYRAAAVSEPYDGAADGLSSDTPAPIDTGVASDLAALEAVFLRMKKQARKDINGDVEA